MIKNLKNNLLWTEGKRDLIISLFLILFCFFFSPILFILLLMFLGFLFYFYRNPNRLLKKVEDNIVISPCDGKVIVFEPVQNGYKLSIFLSPFNVHVNWIPMNGIIKSVEHKTGKFLAAFKSESSEVNERNIVEITGNCGSITVAQVAGFLARRIVCWIQPESIVQAGTKYGMIKFGSRIDLLLPNNFVSTLAVGDTVKGGETILGKLKC